MFKENDFEEEACEGRAYVNAARFVCVREGGFEKRKGICLKTGLMLKAGPFLCRPNPVSRKVTLKRKYFWTTLL